MEYSALFALGFIILAILFAYIRDVRSCRKINSDLNFSETRTIQDIWPDTFNLNSRPGTFTVYKEPGKQNYTVFEFGPVTNKLIPVGEATERYPDHISIHCEPTLDYPYSYKYYREEALIVRENSGFIFSGAGTIDETDTLKDVLDNIFDRGLKVSDFEIVEK